MSEPSDRAIDERGGDAVTKTFSIAGQTHAVLPPKPGLYVVATPIGNLGDVTLRALETLAGADLIACEDTRVTRRLLDRYGIKTQLTAYHDRNGSRMRPQILARLEQGARIALVSDAGTPLISDPGFKLVREASAAGYSIVALPGASSILAALVTSALPTDRFLFEGFLPNRRARRKSVLADLAHIDATLVFFESARRMAASLEDMHDVLGDRDAAVLRELTKKFEEAVCRPLSTLVDLYREAPTPKGEIVIVVGPPGKNTESHQSAEDLLRRALTQMSVREASREVADLLKMPKRDVYTLALKLSQESDHAEDP